MPVVPAPAKLLVTGGSGYIGAWVVKQAVDRGYTVLAAVRTKEQGDGLVNTYPEYKGKVEYTVIPDIQKAGAYDNAVKDVDAIIHVASPLSFADGDPEDLVGPAKNGALGILGSAHKFGPKVKRVVLTSSVFAVHPDFGTVEGGVKGPKVIKDTEWNEISVDHIKANGSKSSGWHTYAASKVLAEQAAREFVKNPAVKFDFVSVLPAYTWGPWIHPTAPGKVASSPGTWASFYNYHREAGVAGTGVTACDTIDVRDTAAIHVLALNSPDAANKRIITADGDGPFVWQDGYDVWAKAGFANAPRGTPGAGDNREKVTYDRSTALALFPDFKYIPREQSLTDLGAQYEKEGYFKQ